MTDAQRKLEKRKIKRRYTNSVTGRRNFADKIASKIKVVMYPPHEQYQLVKT